MARCESINVFSQIVFSDVEELAMENNDSESESDVTRSTNLDINCEKDDSEIEELVMENSDSESERDVTISTNLDINEEKNNNESEELVIENSDSESERDVAISTNLEINGEKDNKPNSLENTNSEKLQVNAGPVLSLQCLHDDITDEVLNEKPEDDEPPQPIPVKIVAVNGSSGSMSSEVSQSSIPSRNNWEGAHNFKIKIKCDDQHKRTQTTFFCKSQQKLFVDKDRPFKVLVYAENVPKGSMIKVTALFAMVEQSYEIVQRCPTHSQADFSKGLPAYEHFIQCYSETAVYDKNPDSGKLSVSVPYEKPQGGEKYTTYLFKLTCFSSCSGGINRRPFILVFTLEKDNIPLGRQAINAKVCACPARDFKMDQERGHRKKSRTEETINEYCKELNNSKWSTTEPPSDGGTVNSKYTISVKDPELYLFLKQMKCFYEISAYSEIEPDTC